jgi:hypothetical protein
MSMLFSEDVIYESSVPVASFSYRDMSAPLPVQNKETKPPVSGAEPGRELQVAPGVSPQELNDLVRNARAEAGAETEARLKMEY